MLARHCAAAMVFAILPDGRHSGQIQCQSTLGTAVQAFSSPTRHAIFGHALDEGDVRFWLFSASFHDVVAFRSTCKG